MTVMAKAALAFRVANLEAEVAQLKVQIAKPEEEAGDWLDDFYGAFTGDPHFAEAMRLGREYRESLHPKGKPKTTRKTTKGRAR